MKPSAHGEWKTVKLTELFAMTLMGWEWMRMPDQRPAKYLRSPQGQMWLVVRTVPGGCELCRDERLEMSEK